MAVATRVRALHRRRAARARLGRGRGARRAGDRRAAREGGHGRRGRRRPRRRGGARRARRCVGEDAADRALAPPARARRRDRREPQGAGRARVAQRRQGDLLGQGRARTAPSRTSASTRSAIASIAGRSNPIGGSLLFYSLKEPVGVAGQIVPWNYPLMMATWKLAPALAAGCTVVLKPDPQTPLTALRLAELAAEVGFPPGVVNVVPGDGPTTGAYLVRHPGVDKVAFTGSTETGGEIMRLASDPHQAGHARAGRQEPEPRLRRRRSRRRDPERGLVDLLLGRPELRGALAACSWRSRSTTSSSRVRREAPGS